MTTDNPGYGDLVRRLRARADVYEFVQTDGMMLPAGIFPSRGTAVRELREAADVIEALSEELDRERQDRPVRWPYNAEDWCRCSHHGSVHRDDESPCQECDCDCFWSVAEDHPGHQP